MEMLNNIWSALSTENVDLLNIIFIPLSFIENFLVLKLFANLLNIKYSTRQKLLYIFITPLILSAYC